MYFALVFFLLLFRNLYSRTTPFSLLRSLLRIDNCYFNIVLYGEIRN